MAKVWEEVGWWCKHLGMIALQLKGMMFVPLNIAFPVHQYPHSQAISHPLPGTTIHCQLSWESKRKIFVVYCMYNQTLRFSRRLGLQLRLGTSLLRKSPSSTQVHSNVHLHCRYIYQQYRWLRNREEVLNLMLPKLSMWRHMCRSKNSLL